MRRTSWRIQLGLIAAVQVMAMGTWFSVSAVVPALNRAWEITEMQGVWLTASVQVGFVAGAVMSVVLNLPDRYPPQIIAGWAASGAALATASVALLADSFGAAVALRVLTGVFLAGVYPVGMQLMASWFGRAGRGLALGILVGALSLGSALPHLLKGFDRLPWQGVLLAAAAISGAAALIAFTLVRPGPYQATGRARHRPKYAVEMFKERGPRFANLGYFGHMWELYALWTWLPMFLITATAADEATAATVSFLTIGVAGAAGCLLGGWASGRFGRSRAAGVAMIVSGVCCLLSPLVVDTAWPAVAVLLGVWGASVIADSPVFSTALSEVANSRYTGTALTTQTAIGFLLTLATIHLVPVIADLTEWRYAFLVLAPGPLLGALAMRSYRRHVEARKEQASDSREHSQRLRETPGSLGQR